MSTVPFSDVVRFRGECPRLRTIVAKHDLIGRRGAMAPVLRHRLNTLAHLETLTVLDIGAYDRAFGTSLQAIGARCEYCSVDLDTSLPHDFYRVEDVTKVFDVIAMFEVIEHLAVDQADDLLHKTYNLLAPGGCLLISTPNPSHPARYFTDFGHRQHWPHHDLYAELRHVGFSLNAIEMYGVIYSPRQFVRRVLASARHVAWRAIGLDCRGGLLAIAVKDLDK